MHVKSQNYVFDALAHLETLKADLSRLRLDYNRDNTIVYTISRHIESCELIGQLVKSYDNPNFKLLSCPEIGLHFMCIPISGQDKALHSIINKSTKSTRFLNQLQHA